MDKNTAISVAKDIEAALAPVLSKYNLVRLPKTTRFTDSSVRIVLELETTQKQQKRLEQAAGGLKTFMFNGEHYEIVGLLPGRGFDWVIATNPRGKRFRFRPEQIPNGKPKRTDAQILEDLRVVESELSPENLTCDGELSRSEVARRGRELIHRRVLLIRELGRYPTDTEIWAGVIPPLPT